MIRVRHLFSLLLLSVIVGIAFPAQAQDESIYACYNTTNGQLRRVTSFTECKTPEMPISWGVQGVQGLQGIQGIQGPQGPKGDKGDKGDRGDVGPAGVTGRDGTQGLKGDTGATGATGQSGLNGAAGAQGDPGNTGSPGLPGIPGQKGDKGDQGFIGLQGAAGAQGTTGNQGPVGLQGSAGVQGEQGLQGAQGVPGMGNYVAPNITQAIFGTGPFTHFAGNGWVLETTAPNILQLRTLAGGFFNYSIVYPSSCSGSGAGGSSPMTSAYRFSSSAGDVLSAQFCTEGSPMFVTVRKFGDHSATLFRCYREASNSNSCQRIYQ